MEHVQTHPVVSDRGTGSQPGADGANAVAAAGGAPGGEQGSHNPEDGIATAEFAIVTLAAVGFAGLLVTILGSGDVRELLMGLVRQALSY
jgi:hypothetical protein